MYYGRKTEEIHSRHLQPRRCNFCLSWVIDWSECVSFSQRYVGKVSISFCQETTAKIVMKCNAWSFANLDFRGLGKNLSSHREARRQRSAVSDRIRCYTYKPESFEKQKHPILCTALPWCILTGPRSILSTRQGSIEQRHTRAGRQDNFSFISVGAACTCSLINLSLSNAGPCVPLSHTPTQTQTWACDSLPSQQPGLLC